MERFQRPIDITKLEEAEMVGAWLKSVRACRSQVSTPTKISTAFQIGATALAAVYLFTVMLGNTVASSMAQPVQAASVGERMVRQETIADNNARRITDLEIGLAKMATKVEGLQKDNDTLNGNIAGAKTTMSWFAGAILFANALSVFFKMYPPKKTL